MDKVVNLLYKDKHIVETLGLRHYSGRKGKQGLDLRYKKYVGRTTIHKMLMSKCGIENKTG